MGGKRVEYNIQSEVQLHIFDDFYHKSLASISNMGKTGIGMDLRNESISTVFP